MQKSNTSYCRNLIFAVSVSINCFSQSNNNVKPQFAGLGSPAPLSIGDYALNIDVNNLTNYPVTHLSLSKLKGRLILIDFWGKTCSNCIAALPKFDTIQRKYGSQVQVITASDLLTKTEVDAVLSRFKKTQGLRLPTTLKDDRLTQYFPHKLVSHVVWIGPDGKVKAITGTEYVTEENVKLILEGVQIKWPVKKDVLDFDYDKPFLQYSQNDNLVARPKLFYSAFTGYMEGVDGTDKLIVDSAAKTITKNHFNKTLLQLCDGSLSGSGTGYIDQKLLILETTDPRRFLFSKNDDYYADWAKANTYCYSVTLPLSLSKEMTRAFIKIDLTHWLSILGIKVNKEKRLIRCLALTRTKGDNSLLLSKGGKYEYGLNDNSRIKRLINSPLSNLLWHLNKETPNIPWVVDETGIAKDLKIDLQLEVDSFQDISAVRQSLQQYGLDLIEVKREIEVYVITEKTID